MSQFNGRFGWYWSGDFTAVVVGTTTWGHFVIEFPDGWIKKRLGGRVSTTDRFPAGWQFIGDEPSFRDLPLERPDGEPGLTKWTWTPEAAGLVPTGGSHRYRRQPPGPGLYLLLCYEWTGLRDEKPEKPEWAIRLWDGDWQRRKYTYGTGGWENFEPVCWCELPPVETSQGELL